jgi:hypothetical protein
MSKDDIPAALGILQTTNPAATVIGALLSALPLAAVAVLVIFGYRAAKEASLEGYALAVAAALVCFFRDTLASLGCQPGRRSGSRVRHEVTTTAYASARRALAEAGNAAYPSSLSCGFHIYRVRDNMESPVLCLATA